MKKKISLLCRIAVLLFVLAMIPKNFVYGISDSSAEDRIIESFQTGQSANIFPYGIKTEELEDLFQTLMYTGKLPWFAETYRCTYSRETDYVCEFIPQYLDPEVYDRNLYEQKVAEILHDTIRDGMTPWEKALAIHDYLVLHSAYDETLEKRTGYDLIVNGSSVCNGYSFAYMDLMNRAGVPCNVVVSEQMDHGWNMVQIGEEWYHVDVTWDDPTPNIEGQVKHEYFLCTDEEMQSDFENPHYGWSNGIICSNTDYETAFWDGLTDPIIFLDAQNVMCRTEVDQNRYITMSKLTEQDNQILAVQEPVYYDIGKGKGAYPNFGIALWGNKLYFSAMDGVCFRTIDSTDVQVEYACDVENSGEYIAGCFAEKDKLFLSLADQNHNIRNEVIDLEPTNYHVHHYEAVVTPPTFTEPGYTTYTCSCGVSYKDDWKPPKADKFLVNGADRYTTNQDEQETSLPENTQTTEAAEEIKEVGNSANFQLICFGIIMVALAVVFVKKGK